jgi:hypothetical protein
MSETEECSGTLRFREEQTLMYELKLTKEINVRHLSPYYFSDKTKEGYKT